MALNTDQQQLISKAIDDMDVSGPSWSTLASDLLPAAESDPVREQPQVPRRRPTRNRAKVKENDTEAPPSDPFAEAKQYVTSLGKRLQEVTLEDGRVGKVRKTR